MCAEVQGKDILLYRSSTPLYKRMHTREGCYLGPNMY